MKPKQTARRDDELQRLRYFRRYYSFLLRFICGFKLGSNRVLNIFIWIGDLNMEIEKIELSPKSWDNDRCDMVVSKNSKWREGKCKRFAHYKIEDKKYCPQHAGEECLNYYLLTNGDKTK